MVPFSFDFTSELLVRDFLLNMIILRFGLSISMNLGNSNFASSFFHILFETISMYLHRQKIDFIVL